MKFLAVFVTLAAVAFGYPATTTWTLDELSDALQSPTVDPILVPYLEHALNQMMLALHQGQAVETVTVAMPVVIQYTVQDLSAALKDPNTDPKHIPFLEAALDKLMAAYYAGIDKPTITVVLPPAVAPAGVPDFVDVWPVQVPEAEPEFVDVWPVQVPEAEPGFIDVWPVQVPEAEPDFVDVWPVQVPEAEPGFIDVWPVQVPEEGSVVPAAPAPVQPSSPLVQIIVNVQQASDVSAIPEIERPTPVQVDDALPGWGNFLPPAAQN